MNYRERLLNLIAGYFQFPLNSLGTKRFTKSHNYPDKNQLFQVESNDSFDLYEMVFPYQYYLMDYHVDYYSNLFLTPQSDVFLNIANSSETLSHLHRHNFFEFLYILDGELDFVIESTHRRFLPGECCIINPNVRHVEGRQQHYTALYLCLSLDFFFGLLSDFSKESEQGTELYHFFERNQKEIIHADYLDFHPIFFTQNHFPVTEEILYHITYELLLKNVGYTDLFIGYTKRLFSFLQTSALYTCSNTQFQLSNEKGIFEKTLNYINSQKRKVTRQDLEEALHYNGNYISRVFQQNTGQSLAVYIRNICLNEAANLLLNTTMSTSEIIEQIGLKIKRHFIINLKINSA